jgi:hypothetical protein
MQLQLGRKLLGGFVINFCDIDWIFGITARTLAAGMGLCRRQTNTLLLARRRDYVR